MDARSGATNEACLDGRKSADSTMNGYGERMARGERNEDEGMDGKRGEWRGGSGRGREGTSDPWAVINNSEE